MSIEIESYHARMWFKCELGKEDETMDLFQEVIEREVGIKVHIEPVPEGDGQ